MNKELVKSKSKILYLLDLNTKILLQINNLHYQNHRHFLQDLTIQANIL